MLSPYVNLPTEKWRSKTLELIESHPLLHTEIYEVVLKVWDSIFESGIGSKPFKIGIDLFPALKLWAIFFMS